MNSENLTIFFLSSIIVMTLILPFSVKKVEEEIEAFLLIMGISAVSISNLWSKHLVLEALKEPLPITITVFVMGILLKIFRKKIIDFMDRIVDKYSHRLIVFITVFIIGLTSSITTAIISAILLSEFINILKFQKNYEIKLTVLGCFAIGFGAILTPVGEPLSTIIVSKLKGEPHNADFFYMFKKFWIWIIPFILIISHIASKDVNKYKEIKNTLSEKEIETYKTVVYRAFKVYIFVMALVFLGNGLKPFTERFITGLKPELLYWINIISAILDNATLASAQIVPTLTERQITFIVMGLIISGGMLIPGNIPNIICASKLNIKSKQWAKYGIGYGAPIMIVYFLLLYFFA
ncbi:MAG: DUF1646 domain-containing protein [Elusimicrobiota bacterium]